VVPFLALATLHHSATICISERFLANAVFNWFAMIVAVEFQTAICSDSISIGAVWIQRTSNMELRSTSLTFFGLILTEKHRRNGLIGVAWFISTFFAGFLVHGA
jgi:hypothetical protein